VMTIKIISNTSKISHSGTTLGFGFIVIFTSSIKMMAFF